MYNYYYLLRPVLFALPPEFAHAFTLRCLQLMARWKCVPARPKSHATIKILGLEFTNCLGAAAGIDKNGDYISGLAALGFSFIELGTVTPKPQAGNPKPRVFRLLQDAGLINRLGFNNKGIDYLLDKIQHVERGATLLGINIGKNATTPLESAVADYRYALRKAYPWADYITLNISSPNTQGLRDLQQGSALVALLRELKQQQYALAEQTQIYKPLLVKIAPDLTDDQIKTIADQLQLLQLDGVIATNTTINRPLLKNKQFIHEVGGLSGRNLMPQSTHVVQVLRKSLGNSFPIIGVGGIMSVEDARTKLAAGANLLQVYTGMVYHGPQLVHDIIAAVG